MEKQNKNHLKAKEKHKNLAIFAIGGKSVATAEGQRPITEQTEADSNRSREAAEQKQEIKNVSYVCECRWPASKDTSELAKTQSV